LSRSADSYVVYWPRTDTPADDHWTREGYTFEFRRSIFAAQTGHLKNKAIGATGWRCNDTRFACGAAGTQKCPLVDARGWTDIDGYQRILRSQPRFIRCPSNAKSAALPLPALRPPALPGRATRPSRSSRRMTTRRMIRSSR
jgi:hypothetical protein